MVDRLRVPVEWGGLEELMPALRAWLARRCRDPSDLDDVVQETLLRAARYRGSLVDPARLRGWALRIAANVLCDRARRDRRLQWTELDEEPLEERAASDPGGSSDVWIGDRAFDRAEVLAGLAAALASLKEEDRRVLECYYAAELPCIEIARTCAIPRELVKVRLFRARRRLAKRVRGLLAEVATAPFAAALEVGR